MLDTVRDMLAGTKPSEAPAPIKPMEVVASEPPFAPAVPMRITREMAIAWLGNNLTNRILRSRRVRLYAADMVAGRWRGEDSTIKINAKTGALINGQHRLSALIESGLPFVWMLVQRGDGDAAAFRGDIGLKRSIMEMSGHHNMLVATANALLRTVEARGFTPDEQIAAADAIKPYFNDLSGATARGWSRGGVIAGVIVNMYRSPNNRTAIADQYNGVADDTFGFDLWPSVHALKRQVIGIHGGGSEVSRELIARSMVAFSPQNRELTKIQIKDRSAVIKQNLPTIMDLLGV